MQLTDTLSHNTCSVREEIFRLHVEKVVVISPPSHTKLRLCIYLPEDALIVYIHHTGCTTYRVTCMVGCDAATTPNMRGAVQESGGGCDQAEDDLHEQ